MGLIVASAPPNIENVIPAVQLISDYRQHTLSGRNSGSIAFL